jgi:hypothetical protein
MGFRSPFRKMSGHYACSPERARRTIPGMDFTTEPQRAQKNKNVNIFNYYIFRMKPSLGIRRPVPAIRPLCALCGSVVKSIPDRSDGRWTGRRAGPRGDAREEAYLLPRMRIPAVTLDLIPSSPGGLRAPRGLAVLAAEVQEHRRSGPAPGRSRPAGRIGRATAAVGRVRTVPWNLASSRFRVPAGLATSVCAAANAANW